MSKLIDFNKFGVKWKGKALACYFETKNWNWGSEEGASLEKMVWSNELVALFQISAEKNTQK